MDLKDPILAYHADSNVEAMLVQRFLESRGIEAYAVEDNSLIGHLEFGHLATKHKPQVWVDRSEEQRVAEVLADYEQHKAEREAGRIASESQTIETICEECGQTSVFAGSLNGTTQHCTHCGGYVDVGEFDWPYEEDFGVEDSAEES